MHVWFPLCITVTVENDFYKCLYFSVYVISFLPQETHTNLPASFQKCAQLHTPWAFKYGYKSEEHFGKPLHLAVQCIPSKCFCKLFIYVPMVSHRWLQMPHYQNCSVSDICKVCHVCCILRIIAMWYTIVNIKFCA